MAGRARGHAVLVAALLALAWGCDDDGGGSTPAADAGMGGAPGAGGTPGAGGAPGMGGAPGGADVDEVIDLPGLSAKVDVHIDPMGIPHLLCATDADCFAAQGYLHARHRFSQMDISRRFPSGRLSELVGNVVLETDVASRRFNTDRTGTPIEEKMAAAMDDDTRAAFEAYARGVNAWIAHVKAGDYGAQRQDEYTYALVDQTALPDWESVDSVRSVLLVIRQLTDFSAEDLYRGEVFAALDPALAFDAVGPLVASPSAILPTAEGQPKAAPRPELEALRAAHARLAPARRALKRAAASPDLALVEAARDRGSNNWVVGGAHTASGQPLLANDPHLGLSNPSVWYPIHLDSVTRGTGTLKVAGVSFPGLPAVVIGHNEHLAWGFTTTYFDMTDVYVETLSPDGRGVMHDGQVVPFVEKDFTFGVSMGEPVTRTFQYVPHHGPVLSIDADAGIAITVRWSTQDASTDANYLLGMARATTVAEARQTLRNLTTIGQNVVVADRAGGIGWFPYNQVPSRPWASAQAPNWLPLDGEGGQEWDGYVDYDDLPQALDPAGGFIATANNDMTGAFWDGDPTNEGQAALQTDAAAGYRHERIVQGITARDDHTRETMNALLGDVHSLVGERMTPPLLMAVDGAPGLDAAGAKVRDALAAWDFDCPSGLDGVDPETATPVSGDAAAASIGCAAFHVLLPRLVDGAMADELASSDLIARPFLVSFVNLVLRPDALQMGADWWDDVSTDEPEDMAAIVAAAMNDAGAFLETTLGDDPDTWRWGRLHTVTLRANLFDDAGIPNFNNGPYVNDGGWFTVDVANPSGMYRDDYAHRSGASMRFACDLPADAPVACTLQVPGGNVHFRDDPHYDDQLKKWLVNEPFDLHFTADAVLGHTERIVRFEVVP